MDFFAPAARGLETLLATELESFGAEQVRVAASGVAFSGSLPVAYRACLWSRVASRILQPIAEFAAPDEAALYAGVDQVDWSEFFRTGATLAVRASLTRSALQHSHFAALRVKDAVVDQLRAQHGRRPAVDRETPDVPIDLHVRRDHATLSLDLAGRPLNHRGYRIGAGPAPLKETLAAALLLRADWPTICESGGALVDPMCGSATLLIEGAMMASDEAPGLARPDFALTRWPSFDEPLWESLLDEARERERIGRERLAGLALHGADVSGRALHAARQNLVRAGLSDYVTLHKTPIDRLPPLAAGGQGLVASNPPYGQRVRVEDLKALYAALGDRLRLHYAGWRAALLVADDDLSRATGLRADKRYRVYNGTVPCRIVTAEISREDKIAARRPLSGGGIMARNRLQKNLRVRRKRLVKEGIECYRLYDADLPEYAAAVDVYAGYAHVQEYAAPASIPAKTAQRRFTDLCQAVAEVLEIDSERIVTKRRRRQRGRAQYAPSGLDPTELVVAEGGLEFLVDLTSYLDTGLFIDHRNLRGLIREGARNRRFLNLFAYTGTASVYAAAGGAGETVSIDLSNTYCRWAEKNLKLNGFGGDRHRVVTADCMGWLQDGSERFDLIFVDPPTWSNSKSLERDFSVQDDHEALLLAAWSRLAPGGTLWFSTNYRQFDLASKVAALGRCREMTSTTVPFDFDRRPPHRSWRFDKPDSG